MDFWLNGALVDWTKPVNGSKPRIVCAARNRVSERRFRPESHLMPGGLWRLIRRHILQTGLQPMCGIRLR